MFGLSRTNWHVFWWLSSIRDICCISFYGICSPRRWSWQIPCKHCSAATAWLVKSWRSALRCLYASLGMHWSQMIIHRGKWSGLSLAVNFPLCTFQVYGATYLQKLLEPLLRGVITGTEWQMLSFEVDPTRYLSNWLFKSVLLSWCVGAKSPVIW